MPSKDYTVIVQYAEEAPYNGVSTPATATFTVSGTAATLPVPTNPQGISGTHWQNGRPILDGRYGIAVNAAVVPSGIEIAVAIGAGAYATVATVESLAGMPTVWTGYAPNDGIVRHIKARHVSTGYTASAYTTPVDVTPWTTAQNFQPVYGASGGTVLVDPTAETVNARKVTGSGATPGIAATADIGTSPTVTISGTDMAGKVHITIGTSPSAFGDFCTITFATPFATAPFVVVNGASASAAISFPYASAISTTGFKIRTSNTFNGAGASHDFYYQVIG